MKPLVQGVSTIDTCCQGGEYITSTKKNIMLWYRLLAGLLFNQLVKTRQLQLKTGGHFCT